jgi:hypothetical protein
MGIRAKLRSTRGKNAQPTSPRRMGPFALLTTLWKALFFSLILDGIILVFCSMPIIPVSTTFGSALCALIALPFLNPKRISSYLTILRNAQNTNSSTIKKIYSFLVFICLIGTIMMKLSGISILHWTNALLFGLFVLIWGGLLLNHYWTVHRNTSQIANTAPWYNILSWERQLVYFNLVPLMAARGISFFAIIGLNSNEITGETYGYLAISIVFLLLLKPRKEYYVGKCPSCRRDVPIAFTSYQTCPSCDATLAEALLG